MNRTLVRFYADNLPAFLFTFIPYILFIRGYNSPDGC